MNSTKIATVSLCVSLFFLLAFSSLIMKNKVQELEKELNTINNNIQEDIKAIHVLKAEWSHLNNPTRLRKLASKHISLNPIQAEQIINYSALPFNYENGDSRRIAAQKNISKYAEQRRELKRLTSAHR